MERRKHKRDIKNHVIIVTSDATDADVKQIRIRTWLFRVLLIIGCVIIGAVVGYFINEGRIRAFMNRKTDAQQTVINQLEEENARLAEEKQMLEKEMEKQISDLEIQIENLNSSITVLSETLKQKTQNEEALLAILDNEKIPSEYPLTGSARQENSDANICIFTASTGATVIATANGTVTAINDDGEFGHNVWVDHGNGYITIYRNSGNPIVKLGDSVVHGTTIFVIDSKNKKFGYQIMQDDEYINPMEMISING